MMTCPTGGPMLLAMTEWIPYTVMAGCVILLALVAVLFRKLYRFGREVKAKEQSLQQLDRELAFKEQIQEKAVGVIADVDTAAPQLEELLHFYVRQFKMGWAGLICPEHHNGEGIILQVPSPAVVPEQFLEWLRQRTSPAAGGGPAPFRLGTGESPGFLDPSGGLPAQPALVFPILHRGASNGAIVFCLPAAEMERQEKELCRVGKLFEALVSYRMLQSEIAFRTEEANVVSLFLTEISTFATIDKLIDAVYDYFRDTYPLANVTLLIEPGENTPRIQKGTLLDENTIEQLLPRARQEHERGRPMLYGPDPLSLVKKFGLSQPPRELQAALVVPLVTFNQVFGFLILESRQANPFKSGTLSTLIRLVEIGSFVLRKVIFFQEEVGKRVAELDGMRLELAVARRTLDENEMVLREITNYNAIFALTQGIRISLTSLKGFLQLGENNLKTAAPAAYDPVFFRNCVAELEKIEKGAQKLELSRIITDREFAFKTGDVDALDFFSRAFQGIRSKAVLKRIEVDNRFDTRLQHLVIDPDVTALVLQQFLERLLDFVAAGKMQALAVAKETEVELLVRFQPNDFSGRLVPAAGVPDLRTDFHYILMKRTITRQGGQMDLEATAERGFVLRLQFIGQAAG